MTKTDLVISNDSTQVTLEVTAFRIVWNKTLQVKLTSPQAKSNWGDGPKTTKMLDLLRIEKSFVVGASITEGQSSGDTSSVAEDKKDDLLSIIEGGGVFSLAYGGKTYNANLDGIINIEEQFGLDGGTESTGMERYTVQMTLTIGADL